MYAHSNTSDKLLKRLKLDSQNTETLSKDTTYDHFLPHILTTIVTRLTGHIQNYSDVHAQNMPVNLKKRGTA